MTTELGDEIEAAEPSPDNTGRKQRAAPFQPGQSGNPAGRPKGARNKLGEDFIADFHAAWQEHGAAAIEKVARERPQDFLRAAVAILPREVSVKTSELDDLTDDQLSDRIRRISKALRETGFDFGDEPGDEQVH